jgi:hypothetical protein
VHFRFGKTGERHVAAARITCYVRQYNEFITDVRSVATMESGNPQRYFVRR